MLLDNIVGLDFETYGAVDLPTHGLHRYTSSSTFTPLIASLAISDHRNRYRTTSFEFTKDFDTAVYLLAEALNGKRIAAHNAGFEQRVLASIGIDVPSDRFVDSAVLARAAGGGSSLEAAAPQLLGSMKLEAGKKLIQLFSIPGKYQEETGSLAFDRRIIADHPDEWLTFIEYCEIDATLSLRLAYDIGRNITDLEMENAAITMDMNNIGWPVDVPKVEEMQRRYLENREQALCDFRLRHNATDLNLNSLKQMKEWCEKRGVKAKSFDEKHVAAMIVRLENKLDSLPVSDPKATQYAEVLDLMRTKQILGGSSLKKLQVILDTTGKDCRLRDQYLHIGAGQSYRTTGRSVQMQNLKRLAEPADMDELDDFDSEWDNTKLAENLRQVFTSSHPQGALVVGDFSSVESRGLAWLAGEDWKLDSYRQGKDMYKVLAAKIYDIDYADVTKPQRQTGKVGELSCGYGAGGGAVQMFAQNMGVDMSEGEATKLVTDWRAANPMIVRLWENLDSMLNTVLDGSFDDRLFLDKGFSLRLYRTTTPASLVQQHADAASIALEVSKPDGTVMLTRYFHGCYRRGRNVCYYKPSQRKTGDLWSSHFVDPKTKQVKFYSIYGGKLAGILTQSFCRELFFMVLREVNAWTRGLDNVDLIGQFHDEIVLDWTPTGDVTLPEACDRLHGLMSDNSDILGFPLDADIKHDYRYTK